MSPVVKTFLLVSAAYLLGGPPAALANRDGRESASRSAERYAAEEYTDEESWSAALYSTFSRPTASDD